MNDIERDRLLERVERESAPIGAQIPERITVQGDEVDLREFVFEVRRRDAVPASERERVDRAKKNLRRERLQRKQRLEEGDISYEEGSELVESIVGIDRALNALEGLGTETDIEAENRRAEKADQQRWMNFLKQVLGQDDTDDRRRMGP